MAEDFVERDFDLPIINEDRINFSRLENELASFIPSNPEKNVALINSDACWKKDVFMYFNNDFTYTVLGQKEKDGKYQIKIGANI